MSDRTRPARAGDVCITCNLVAFGGEPFHPTRAGAECASCHRVEAFDQPIVTPAAAFIEPARYGDWLKHQLEVTPCE